MPVNDGQYLECDIAIVGGGLAGLCSALAIVTQCAARVVLIDASPGSNRSLPLTFLDVVRQFGLESSVLERYHSFTMRTRTGRHVSCTFDDPPLVALDYPAACACLYAHLQAHPSFTHLPARATGLDRDPEGWRIRVPEQGGVACSLLIDASGRAHFSARQLGQPTPPMYSHSYGQIFAGCSVPAGDESVALFLTGNPRHGNGGGWFYPLRGQRASFGFAIITRSSKYPEQACRQGFEHACREFLPYAEMLRGAVPEETHAGSIPIGPVKHLAHDRLMLVGDAAGQATPWVCMGVEPALLNGRLCGRVAARAFRERDLGRSRLREYERAWKARNHAGYRKAVLLADLEWQRGEAVWEHTMDQLGQLSAAAFLESLRYNTPHFPLLLIWWLLGYDRLGLVRRAIVGRLRPRRGRQDTRGR